MTINRNTDQLTPREHMEASLRQLEADPLFRAVRPDPDAPVTLTFLTRRPEHTCSPNGECR